MIKHFGGDRGKTARFMDLDNEWELLNMYRECVWDNMDDARERGDEEKESWFEALWREVRIDRNQVEDFLLEHDMKLLRRDDGQ